MRTFQLNSKCFLEAILNSLCRVGLHPKPLPLLAQLIRVSSLKLENEALEPLVTTIDTLANIKGSYTHQREVKLSCLLLIYSSPLPISLAASEIPFLLFLKH